MFFEEKASAVIFTPGTAEVCHLRMGFLRMLPVLCTSQAVTTPFCGQTAVAHTVRDANAIRTPSDVLRVESG